MFKTRFLSNSEIKRNWYIIDAKGKNLGKLSTEISKILMGKHKSEYSSNNVFSDHVVVINTKYLNITDKKKQEKVYYTHSGYPGGLTSKKLDKVFENNPEFVLKSSIFGMLPKNKLRDKMIKYLHVYSEDSHEYTNVKFINV